MGGDDENSLFDALTVASNIFIPSIDKGRTGWRLRWDAGYLNILLIITMNMTLFIYELIAK